LRGVPPHAPSGALRKLRPERSIENLLLFIPGAAEYAPGAAGLTLAGKRDELSAGIGALLLLLYAIAVSARAGSRPFGRDVT
jgi:hypothetical protein